MNISNLQEKKVAELQQIARELGLTGLSQMRKQDLIYHILEAHAVAASENGRRNRPDQTESDYRETDFAASEEPQFKKQVDRHDSEPVQKREQGQGQGQGQGTNNPSLVPWTDVYQEFNDFARTSLDRSYVPIEVKDYVRDYFSSFEQNRQEGR
jgi:hypothetical protein